MGDDRIESRPFDHRSNFLGCELARFLVGVDNRLEEAHFVFEFGTKLLFLGAGVDLLHGGQDLGLFAFRHSAKTNS